MSIDLYQVKLPLPLLPAINKNKQNFARALYTIHAESSEEVGLKLNDLIILMTKRGY
jgi:hypothetical protein